MITGAVPGTGSQSRGDAALLTVPFTGLGRRSRNRPVVYGRQASPVLWVSSPLQRASPGFALSRQ
jgi:hypothetical protein